MLRDVEEEGGPLRQLYYKMLPFLGIDRKIKGVWHHLHSTFGGVGLRRILTKVVIAHINLFLQHYRSPFKLQLELGVQVQHSCKTARSVF